MVEFESQILFIEVKTALGAPRSLFHVQWMSLIRHDFGESLRVNSGEPNEGEFSLFWSENFFILDSKWMSSVTRKVKHFSDNLGWSRVIFFC